jgi:putative ABC transport system substrate-binding protein
MKRILLWLVTVVLLLGSVHHLARAQQRRIPVVARLSSGPSGDPLQKAGYAAFQEGLRELGWLESQNIRLEPRWTGDNPEKARDLVADLVRRGADVIVAMGVR